MAPSSFPSLGMESKQRMEKIHTSSPPRAHSPIARATRIATNIPHPRIQQSLAFKRLAKQVLDAPETAGGYGAFLCVGWEVGGGTTFGVEGYAGGRGEGAEEAIEEIGHCRGHDEGEDGEDESFWELQFEGYLDV